MGNNGLLRKLPKIDQVLNDQRLVVFYQDISREAVADIVRTVEKDLRREITEGYLEAEEGGETFDGSFFTEIIIKRTLSEIEQENRTELRKVINATGVIIHTNLGRSPMPLSACRNVTSVSSGYSNLEYDLEKGIRGSRHDHVEKLICDITGAESAMMVNNNASATLLCLAAMAGGREVLVSRGELVEIGGSFRIPDIMEVSRAVLKEVGTTNKTRKEDYEAAVTENTALILKIHTSNYKIIGFTEEATLDELSETGRKRNLPVVYDMGSGILSDLSSCGVDELTVSEALKKDIDVIFFSGDKLMGGPQAGIIAGRREYIDLMKKHPLARVVRADKMCIAAMESVLRTYKTGAAAFDKIPVLHMLCAGQDELMEKGKKAAEKFKKALGKNGGFTVEAVRSEDRTGGGTAPDKILNGCSVALESSRYTSEEIEQELREYDTPVIVRINKGKVHIGMRTLTDEDIDIISGALAYIYGGDK